MPLGVHPPRTQRTWGVGLSSVLGLAVFVIYYGVLSIGIAMAEGNKISPSFALWMPNAIVCVFASFFSLRIASERWQSVADGIMAMSETISRHVPFRRRRA